MNGICNITRDDGFGAQLQCILWTYIYCRMNNIKFYYSPIENIAHNYNNDPEFITKIENLINLKDNIEVSSSKLKETIKKIRGPLLEKIYKYIERNINTDE